MTEYLRHLQGGKQLHVQDYFRFENGQYTTDLYLGLIDVSNFTVFSVQWTASVSTSDATTRLIVKGSNRADAFAMGSIHPVPLTLYKTEGAPITPDSEPGVWVLPKDEKSGIVFLKEMPKYLLIRGDIYTEETATEEVLGTFSLDVFGWMA